LQIKEKITKLLKVLSEGIYEKEEVIHLALLSTIAGESIFLLGPPGVAKSLIARKLKYAFKEGKSFEYLMSRFSTPDEVFGPVSIKKLKDEDKYERLTEKYLPGANIVFLDEIWKSGPAIQNALLTILNEKIYRNGEQEVQVSIRGIISASNEVPLPSDGVDALWDRFLLRYFMQEIKVPKNFMKMITATENIYEDNIPEELKVTEEELQNWQKGITNINVPPEVVNSIQLIKAKLDEYNQKQNDNSLKIKVYDRRWKKIINLLRTSAFLNQRQEVDLMDCFLIVHCLWSKPEQFDVIMEIVSDTIRKHGYYIALNLSPLKKEIREFEAEIMHETKITNVLWKEELLLIESEYFEILNASQYFDGQFIKANDFRKLSVEEMQSVSLFDKNYALTNRVNAKLGRDENTIEIFYNSKMIIFSFKTKKVETKTHIEKKPHPIVEKYWQEHSETLSAYIQKQKAKIDTEEPEAMKHLKENIFVPPQLSHIVESNLQDTQKTLNTLALQVEKLVHYYQSL